ncbi:glycosyl hydrolase [Halobaculum halobium]|uniref:Glycosyl hydrolase n=1 Tax=Halobaculum halobium TaxID=3032281 RepID=A0ABD5T6D3_9EURY|nr:glycosyl hydrolase [Halobaculum sp. SYNS20]
MEGDGTDGRRTTGGDGQGAKAVKLETVVDGTLVATRDRAVYRGPVDGRLRRVGRLPTPTGGLDGLRFHLRTTRAVKRAVSVVTGRFPSVNVEVVDSQSLVATAGTWVFASPDRGATWRVTARLPDSSGPMGVLPSALCAHEGTVTFGEYPLAGDKPPRIRRSRDGGATWETVLEVPGVRHIHGVTRDPYTGEWWVTTGDTDDECYIGRLRDGEFVPVGGGSQQWRAVELAFTEKFVLWGVDCNYTSDRRIYRLPRGDLSRADPTPTPVASLSSPVFYAAAAEVDGERWVAFATAASANPDSTGPEDNETGSDVTRVVAASSASAYERWYEVTSGRRQRGFAERVGADGIVPPTNAYTFLESDGERLLVNPYNTREDDGQILSFGREYFSSVAERSRVLFEG